MTDPLPLTPAQAHALRATSTRREFEDIAVRSGQTVDELDRLADQHQPDEPIDGDTAVELEVRYAEDAEGLREEAGRLHGVTPDQVHDTAERHRRDQPEQAAKRRRDAALGLVNRWCGLDLRDAAVASVTQRGDPPVLTLHGPRGAASLDPATKLKRFDDLAPVLHRATGVWPQKSKRIAMRSIAVAVTDAAEPEAEADDETEAGLGREWVIGYLTNRAVIEAGERDADSDRRGDPFRGSDGRIHLFGAAHRQWIEHIRSERVTARQYGTIMRAAGCEVAHVHVTTEGGGRTTRSTWRVPPDLDPRGGQ